MKKVIKKIDEVASPMQKLLEEDKIITKLPQVGDLVKGKIISITKKEILIDIEGLTTGIIRGKELSEDAEELNKLKIGDEIEATVIDMENEQDMMELSIRYAGDQKAWETLQQNKAENKILDVKILDANKGGLLIMLNHIQGFLPVSQLNPEHYPRIPGGDKNKILEKLKSYVGQTFQVKIMDVDEKNKKLIVSEKAAWEESQSDVLKKYQVGTVIEGEITAITDFGVFVKFGENLEGLVHISELAWQRIEDPNALFKVGQKIKSEIIKIEGSKIFLSIKKLQKDPWLDIEKKYKIGQEVEGKVIKVNTFGLFVELDKDIHGLAHVSELTNKQKQSLTLPEMEKIAKVGDVKKFVIVSLEPQEHRLGLSLAGDKKTKKEDKIEKTKE